MKTSGPIRSWAGALLAVALLAFAAAPSQAQVTTGSLSGTVVDESGGVLPGAQVTAVHEPTGTSYSAVTGTDGRFAILNLRVGPYTVSVTMPGFKQEQQKGIDVRLGEERAVPFRLIVAAMTETVEVTAATALISPSHTGPASNVSQETIRSLPTVSRGIEDFARLNPYFATVPVGSGNSVSLSVAGRNNRYNNFQIDGAVNNDLFGLAANGAPGGQADTQPVSLDAIEEIQLLVAPYDVRQGGFSGGGINAVTKSGTNAFGGTAYYFLRNQNFVGKGVTKKKVGTFDDKQFGASIGGPIQKDKIFFFVNAEGQRRKTPTGFSADGASGANFGHSAEVQRFLSILQSKYNYDAGGVSEFTKGTTNNKIFARLDFNLSPKHRLTVRHNYIKGDNDLNGNALSPTQYIFPDDFYQFNSKTNSTVAQLNSSLGAGFNELRLTYQKIRESRGTPTSFPQVTVRLPDGTRLVAGSDEFSAANALSQDIFEVTDDFTTTRGKHTITVGTHNEFFKFENLFIRDQIGAYQFSSLDNLQAGLAQQYDLSFSVTGNAKQAAKFKVNQLGFYLGDMWRVRPRVTLTYGVRIDKPFFPTKPTANPASVANFGFKTDEAPNPTMFSPRIGFNWDLSGAGKEQVRGGVGMFAGRTPYVWLSNQYGNTGIEFQRIGAAFNAANKVPFAIDPNGQPHAVTGASAGAFTNEIDLVDPKYTFPRVLRGNLAYDRELGVWGLLGTVEVLGSKTLKDIDYRNLNLVPSGRTLFDGRPIFARKVTTLSDVVLLTNTDEGSQWSASGKLERPFKNGLYLSASYIYSSAKSINDGGSSQALSNWRFVYNPGDPNNVPLAFSNFDVRHRVNAAISYDWRISTRFSSTFSLFYNGQTGRPYTVDWNTDVNGDGTNGNDIMFVPANVSDVIVTGGTPAQLEAFIANDNGLSKNRGKIPGRNSSRMPRTDTVDFKAAFGVPFGKRKVELTVDVLNLTNLIDRNKGLVKFVTNNELRVIQFGGIDAATSKPIYNIATITGPTFSKFITDDLRSRWQAQFGARIRF